MTVTLPASYRERLEPFARERGKNVEEYLAIIVDDWLSWKVAEPALEAALNGPPAEPLAAGDFENARSRIRTKFPEAFRE